MLRVSDCIRDGIGIVIPETTERSTSEIRSTPRLSLRGRTVVSVRFDGKRFVVRADEKLTAFGELEAAIHEFAMDLLS